MLSGALLSSKSSEGIFNLICIQIEPYQKNDKSVGASSVDPPASDGDASSRRWFSPPCQQISNEGNSIFSLIQGVSQTDYYTEASAA